MTTSLVSLVACLAAMAAPAAALADEEGQSQSSYRANHAPTGSITYSPAPARSGDTITFSANPVDSDGDAVTASWDIDGDGRIDTVGPTATARWTAPGVHLIRVLLRDARGAMTLLSRTVEVVNAPPIAAFTFGPATPLVGADILLTSQSSDPDGGTLDLQQSWDLNGDGTFDDVTGPTAHVAFPAGEHIVRLRVTDAKGAVTVAEQRIVVVAPAPISASTSATVRPLSPFPVVRLSGRLTAGGVSVELLSVFAPRGSHVAVRCRGGGCPRRLIRRVVPRRGPRIVRIGRLSRILRPGSRIEVRVTKKGFTGKYTRFVVRSNGAPRRSDRCLPPGTNTPRTCR